MIPTIIVVNDANTLLSEYTSLFKLLTRVVERSSFQGEQLYSDGSGPFVEGVLFFDASGRKRVVRRDNYTNLISEIVKILINSNPETIDLVKEYFKSRPTTLNTINQNIKKANHLINEESRVILEQYVVEIYDSKSSVRA